MTTRKKPYGLEIDITSGRVEDDLTTTYSRSITSGRVEDDLTTTYSRSITSGRVKDDLTTTYSRSPYLFLNRHKQTNNFERWQHRYLRFSRSSKR